MNGPVIFLHEEALRMSHPVFNAAPEQSRVIHVWDDEYLKKANHSFKRLVFIYETLCGMPIEVLQGHTVDVMTACNPSAIYVPFTNNPLIIQIVEKFRHVAPVSMVKDEKFTNEPAKMQGRFFNYWKQIEKSAFMMNGGVDESV